MTVEDIAPERIEIGPVQDRGETRWMMFLIEESAGPGDTTYAETYPTREAAVEAASSWDLPIRFIHDLGIVADGPSAPPTSVSGIPLTRRST